LAQIKELSDYLKQHGPYLEGEQVSGADLSLAPKLYHAVTALKHFKVGRPAAPVPDDSLLKLRVPDDSLFKRRVPDDSLFKRRVPDDTLFEMRLPHDSLLKRGFEMTHCSK
jgi:Glutathione S-transferase, C-terminal domain